MLAPLLILAAILPGASNNRILVLGPKASSASQEVREAAIVSLALGLEKQRLTSRRLESGNLLDIKGKRLLKDPIPVRLRSLLKAGCEQSVCALALRKAFNALGGVARVRVEPLGKGGSQG